jgi:DNA-binding response OmpR family regulator
LFYHVLVVDDEQDVLDVLVGMLNAMGFKATGIESGQKAIELFMRQKYDLVIADLIMPEINGLDILKELRRHDQDTPVIITAGVDIGEARIDLASYGKCDFVKKPFTLAGFSEKLKKYFKWGSDCGIVKIG